MGKPVRAFGANACQVWHQSTLYGGVEIGRLTSVKAYNNRAGSRCGIGTTIDFNRRGDRHLHVLPMFASNRHFTTLERFNSNQDDRACSAGQFLALVECQLRLWRACHPHFAELAVNRSDPIIQHSVTHLADISDAEIVHGSWLSRIDNVTGGLHQFIEARKLESRVCRAKESHDDR